jgi:hypothetical protein
MTWSAAVYCTQVDPNTVMVCYTAPWFSWTCSAPWTLPAALLQGEQASDFAAHRACLPSASSRYLVAKQLPRFLRRTSCSVSLIARLWVD